MKNKVELQEFYLNHKIYCIVLSSTTYQQNNMTRTKVVIFAVVCILSSVITNNIAKGWYKHYRKDNLNYPENYEPLARDQICKECELRIPKKFHRIWLVLNPKKPNMPEIYVKFDKILKDLHPDWEFIEWNDQKIEAFIQKHHPDFWPIYSSYDAPIKKHDAARLLVTNYYGGVFIQHSIMLFKNIEPLLRGYDVVFSQENNYSNQLINGFFATVPNHRLFKKLISKLPIRQKLDVLQAGGPNFVTYNIHEYIKENGENGLSILPTKYLVPFDYLEKNKEPIYSSCIKSQDKCFDLFKEAYGFCVWTGSWIKKD